MSDFPVPAAKVVPSVPRRVVDTRYGRNAVAPVDEAPKAVVPRPSEERMALVRAGDKERLARNVLRRKAATDTDGEPSPVGGVVRAGTTIQTYRARGAMLLRRFRRERDLPDDMDGFDPEEFAFWFLSIRPTVKPGTWRFYKQSVIMLLGGVPTQQAEAAMAMVAADAPGDVEMATGEPAKPRTDRRVTSALKEKRLPWDDWYRIDASLSLSKRSLDTGALRDWLRAGLAVGLRPIEWAATEVVYSDENDEGGRQRCFLHVFNAKATNGRGNGVVRTVELTGVSYQTLGSVERMSNQGAAWSAEGTFDFHQRKCSQLLYKTSERLFRRRKLTYALYSCRHQFIANMKSLGLANEEISAMCGHVVDETAAKNYAKANSAWSPDKIVDRARGVKEEIATVRKRLVMAEERLRLDGIVKGKIRPDDPAVAGESQFGDP